MQKSLGELIEEYQELPSICASVKLNDEESIKQHNKAIKRMQRIAKSIDKNYGFEGAKEFFKLIDIQEGSQHLWVAMHLLEYMEFEDEMEQIALGIIKKAAEGTSVGAIGYQQWLKDYVPNKEGLDE